MNETAHESELPIADGATEVGPPIAAAEHSVPIGDANLHECGHDHVEPRRHDGYPPAIDSRPIPDEASGSAWERDGTSEASTIAAATRDDAQRLIAQVEQLQRSVELRLNTLERVAETVLMDQDERNEQRRNREALHEKLQASKTSFKYQLLQPLLQRLAGLHDLIGDFSAGPPRNQEALVGILSLLRRHVEQTLELHGIEPIRPQQGDAFDARWHHIVATAPAPDEAAGETIKEVTQIGFLFLGQNDQTGDLRTTVIRPARVVTWKYTGREDTAVDDPRNESMAAVRAPDAGAERS